MEAYHLMYADFLRLLNNEATDHIDSYTIEAAVYDLVNSRQPCSAMQKLSQNTWSHPVPIDQDPGLFNSLTHAGINPP